MIKFHILASGSKGNCCVIQSKYTTILLDCGYQYRYIKKQLENLNIHHFDAMLITHTHSDHIKLLNYFKHVKTYSPHDLDVEDLQYIQPNEIFKINDLTITTLPLSHDIKNTVGFLIETKQESLVYICDTGYVSTNVQNLIYDKTYYILESNHDLEMLMNSNRSMFLKQRIAGDSGHLSNESCADVLSSVVGLNTKQVFLAHLSQEVNTDELCYTTTRLRLPDYIEVIVAKQSECISGGIND